MVLAVGDVSSGPCKVEATGTRGDGSNSSTSMVKRFTDPQQRSENTHGELRTGMNVRDFCEWISRSTWQARRFVSIVSARDKCSMSWCVCGKIGSVVWESASRGSKRPLTISLYVVSMDGTVDGFVPFDA